MDIQRFEQLSAAYGGDVRRWPQVEREGASVLIAAQPEAAAAILREADSLDMALEASRPPVPSAALREAILMSAPRSGNLRPKLSAWDRLWAPRAGVAAAAVIAIAGILCGAVLVGAIAADPGAEAMVAAASSTPEDTGSVTNWLEDRAT